MKIKNYMLVVKDLEKSKDFYWKVLGLRTLADMGIHAVLTGGLALQTEGSFKEFTGKEISYHGNDTEIYFEEDDFDRLCGETLQYGEDRICASRHGA